MMSGRDGPGYGEGFHEISEEDALDLGLAPGHLAKELTELFSSPGYTPPVLPSVALELHSLASRPDVTMKAIVRLLEKDSFLAAGLLRRAQSPMFSSRVPPRSIDDAVTRLGISNIRDIVWELALGLRVFRAKGFENVMESVQRHSTATAYAARIVSSYTPLASEYAFLCGLLHDVGIAASLIAIANQGRAGRHDLLYLGSEINSLHEEAAVQIAELWKLPPEVGWVLGSHHSLLVGNKPHPLSAIVCVAQQVANELGYPICFCVEGLCDISAPSALTRAREVLGLGSQQLALIQKDAEQVLAQLSST